MTKMKSKKMTKSTFAIIIMAIVMVAMLAFGGTYAYFTAQVDDATAQATTGTVQLTANSIAELNALVVPTEDLIKGEGKVTVTPNSDVKTFVFVSFTATLEGDTNGTNYVKDGSPLTEGKYSITPNVSASTWTQLTGTNVYYTVVEAAAGKTAIDVCTDIIFDGVSASNGATAGSLMGKKITVTIDSSAIQYAGFDDIGTGKTYETELAAATAAYAFATITEPVAG